MHKRYKHTNELYHYAISTRWKPKHIINQISFRLYFATSLPSLLLLLIFFLLRHILINVIELNVLVLLRDYLCLNFSCRVCSTTDKNQNRCARESPKSGQVRSLLDNSGTCCKNCQKGGPKNRYSTENLDSKNQKTNKFMRG